MEKIQDYGNIKIFFQIRLYSKICKEKNKELNKDLKLNIINDIRKNKKYLLKEKLEMHQLIQRNKKNDIFLQLREKTKMEKVYRRSF